MSAALLGSRISLISKKNIRYEGTLYSINEQDATVALQNVRSYGTEGREKEVVGDAFVPPSDAVHPYLLFRGCDIKDLHVHEEAKTEEEPEKPPEDPAILSAEVPEEVKKQQQQEQQQAADAPKQEAVKSIDTENKPNAKRGTRGGKKAGGGAGGSRSAIGTGQNLMNRKERGVVDGAGPEPYKDANFDIQGNLEQFDKSDDDLSDDDDDIGAYEKDDFFDTISSDVTDRAEGKSTGLRGAEERKLNSETFGATSLDSGRRRGGRRRGGRGYGGRGRGRGRGGRGGGRGGGNRRSNYEATSRGGAPSPVNNNRWDK